MCACPTGSFPYTIQANDTYWRLAQRFNTTVEAIIAANPGVDPDRLQIGQVICIPGVAPPPACPPGSTSYIVRYGDTLYSIARQYQTTVSAILAINPGLDPNNLRVGQTICIPGIQPPVCPSGSIAYTVRAGDTVYSIARMYNITVGALLAANPGLDPDRLQIGQTICVPVLHACPPNTTPYVIRPGDTYVRLAQYYGISVEAIIAANPGVDPGNLRVGQVICLPVR